MIQSDGFQGLSSICRVEGENLLLSTGMDEAGFGKTRLATTLTSDAGIFAELTENTGTWKFSKWHFTEIHSEKTETGETVFLSGKLPKPAFAESFSEPQTPAKAAFLIVNAISAVLDSNQELNAVGSGGIIAGKGGVLFLPKNIFENSVNSLDESLKAELNGKYIFKGLSQKNELCFLRSVIAYKALCGKYPFNACNEAQRQKDIIDSFFLPIEYQVNGIDSALAKAIDEGLSAKVNCSSQLQKNFPLEIFKSSLQNANRKNSIPEEDFKKIAESYFAKKTKKIKTQRFIQKNKIALLACIAASCIAISAVTGSAKRLSNLPTTRGLSSFETVEQLYKGIHSLDIELLQEVGKGSDCKGILNAASAMFVTHKTREGYSGELTFMPEKWFTVMKSADNPRKLPWMYGLTKAVINGNKANLQKEAPKRKDKLPPVMEAGKVPQSGDEKKYTAEYFRIFTHGEEAFLTIEKTQDFITEVFEKDRWIVTSVESTIISTEEIPMQKVYDAYKKELSVNGGNTEKAIKNLKESFAWMPE